MQSSLAYTAPSDGFAPVGSATQQGLQALLTCVETLGAMRAGAYACAALIKLYSKSSVRSDEHVLLCAIVPAVCAPLVFE